MSREPVTPDTIEALATRLADVPVSPEKAHGHATVFESLMAVIVELRLLPLKEVEPAVIFAPEEEGQ